MRPFNINNIVECDGEVGNFERIYVEAYQDEGEELYMPVGKCENRECNKVGHVGVLCDCGSYIKIPVAIPKWADRSTKPVKFQMLHPVRLAKFMIEEDLEEGLPLSMSVKRPRGSKKEDMDLKKMNDGSLDHVEFIPLDLLIMQKILKSNGPIYVQNLFDGLYKFDKDEDVEKAKEIVDSAIRRAEEIRSLSTIGKIEFRYKLVTERYLVPWCFEGIEQKALTGEPRKLVELKLQQIPKALAIRDKKDLEAKEKSSQDEEWSNMTWNQQLAMIQQIAPNAQVMYIGGETNNPVAGYVVPRDDVTRRQQDDDESE